MIMAAEGSGTFQRPKVGEVFDDAEHGLVPLRVAADRTWLDRIEIAADRTRPYRLRRLGECGCERLEQALPPLDQMQSRAPRRTRAEAGQLGKKTDQRLELRHRIRR